MIFIGFRNLKHVNYKFCFQSDCNFISQLYFIMYKTFAIDDILQVKTNLLSKLRTIYEKEWFLYFKQFIKHLWKDVIDEVLYLSAWEVYFRIIFKDNSLLEIVDENQSIKLVLDTKSIDKLHNILKSKINNSWKKTIANLLIEKFETENMKTYLWKHFLVYDIETIWSIQDLTKTKFMMWYMIDSKDFEKGYKPKYKYISENALDKFVQYLYEYDWYIVWYNNIWFDNPVVVYNSSFKDNTKFLEELNKKSLDLFYVYTKILWKRIWLNAVATNIVWITKTLSSWLEGANLLKQYIETKDEKLLNKVKFYCKNDVKMTLTILLYLLFGGKITYNEKNIEVSVGDIIKFGCLDVENNFKNNILHLHE